MTKLARVFALCLGFSSLGCGGGGGGGSSSGFYAGTWDISAVRVLNDCGVAISQTMENTVVVNQDGNRIVVDAGSRVLQGQVTDRDGFTATDSFPISNGCVAGAAYSFTDASDGEANVGVVLLVRCGMRECSVGYDGQGIRRTQKSLTERLPSSGHDADITSALEGQIRAGSGESAKGTVDESVSDLAELFAPAS